MDLSELTKAWPLRKEKYLHWGHLAESAYEQHMQLFSTICQGFRAYHKADFGSEN